VSKHVYLIGDTVRFIGGDLMGEEGQVKQVLQHRHAVLQVYIPKLLMTRRVDVTDDCMVEPVAQGSESRLQVGDPVTCGGLIGEVYKIIAPNRGFVRLQESAGWQNSFLIDLALHTSDMDMWAHRIGDYKGVEVVLLSKGEEYKMRTPKPSGIEIGDRGVVGEDEVIIANAYQSVDDDDVTICFRYASDPSAMGTCALNSFKKMEAV
jgi:hypothetical protein